MHSFREMRIASSLLTAVLVTLASTATALAAPPSGSALSQPAWDLPTDTAAAVHAAGLPLLDKMSTTRHYHAHLDVAEFCKSYFGGILAHTVTLCVCKLVDLDKQ